MRAVSEEIPFPFEDVMFHTQCPNEQANHQDKDEYKPLLPLYVTTPPSPLKNDADKESLLPLPSKAKIDPSDVKICYIILIHEHSDFVIQMIKALDEKGHSFILHVDLKADLIYKEMLAFQSRNSTLGTVYILNESEGRQSVTWGGYKMVKATLMAMKTALLKTHFTYLALISGSHYPLRSNYAIRKRFSSNPRSIYMDIIDQPQRPNADMWHQYVECDDALHRIARLPLARGINMYTGSQWFAFPRHVVHWFIYNSLPLQYTKYVQYVVVADENYFVTMVKNSPFCQDIIKHKYVYIKFDKWEQHLSKEKGIPKREDKCLHPNPNHCGRSPTTLTIKYKRLLQVTEHMFARKFDPYHEESMQLVEYVEYIRRRNQGIIEAYANGHYNTTTTPNTDGNSQGKDVKDSKDSKHSTSNSIFGTLFDFGTTKSDDRGGETNIPIGDKDKNQVSRRMNILEEEYMVNRTTFMIRYGGKNGDNDGNSDGDEPHESQHSNNNNNNNNNNNDKEHLCLGMEAKSGASVTLSPCNAADRNQWFEFGPCSGIYHMNDLLPYIDGSCMNHNIIKNFPDHLYLSYKNEEDFSCQIRRSRIPPTWSYNHNQRKSRDKDYIKASPYVGEEPLCLDIFDESPYPGNTLVGWSCLGQWNQLFRFNSDCSVSASQPDFIGRLRDLDDHSASGNVTLCMSVLPDDVHKKTVKMEIEDVQGESSSNRKAANIHHHPEAHMSIYYGTNGALNDKVASMANKKGKLSLWNRRQKEKTLFGRMKSAGNNNSDNATTNSNSVHKASNALKDNPVQFVATASCSPQTSTSSQSVRSSLTFTLMPIGGKEYQKYIRTTADVEVAVQEMEVDEL